MPRHAFRYCLAEAGCGGTSVSSETADDRHSIDVLEYDLCGEYEVDPADEAVGHVLAAIRVREAGVPLCVIVPPFSLADWRGEGAALVPFSAKESMPPCDRMRSAVRRGDGCGESI